MKKILMVLAFLFWVRPAHAVANNVWLSSNTATVDSTQTLCGQYLVGTSTAVYHGVLHEVIVSSAVALSTIQLYNSSWTVVGTTQTIGPIVTGTQTFPFVYDVIFPNGLSYVKSGTSQVQILYQCY
jgi:hypothetical protein